MCCDFNQIMRSQNSVKLPSICVHANQFSGSRDASFVKTDGKTHRFEYARHWILNLPIQETFGNNMAALSIQIWNISSTSSPCITAFSQRHTASSVMERGTGIKTVDLLLQACFILQAQCAPNKRKLIQHAGPTVFYKPIPLLCIRLLLVRSRFDFIHLEENTFLHL